MYKGKMACHDAIGEAWFVGKLMVADIRGFERWQTHRHSFHFLYVLYTRNWWLFSACHIAMTSYCKHNGVWNLIDSNTHLQIWKATPIYKFERQYSATNLNALLLNYIITSNILYKSHNLEMGGPPDLHLPFSQVDIHIIDLMKGFSIILGSFVRANGVNEMIDPFPYLFRVSTHKLIDWISFLHQQEGRHGFYLHFGGYNLSYM